MSKSTFKTIDEYISAFPKEVQVVLQKIRQAISEAVPEAEESISYKMPVFNLHGTYLVYFAAWKNHISLYPGTAGMEAAFAHELSDFMSSKSTIKFPLNQPIPYELIGKIAAFRAGEIRKNTTPIPNRFPLH